MSDLSSFSGPQAASSSTSIHSSTATASSSKIQPAPRRRVIYIGIKRGKVPGVYIDQKLAEEQVIDYPSACLRWFSTRYAAEAYVAGWPWKGELIPKNCPYPLREYLHMTYPNPAYQLPGPSIPPRVNSPSSSREMPGPSAGDGTLSPRASSDTLRPPLGDHRNSWRNSMVKAPSPLRHQVDEQGRISVEIEKVGTPPGTPKARHSTMSSGRQGAGAVTAAVKDKGEGKVKNTRSSIFGLPTFSRKPSAPAKTTTAQSSSSGSSGWSKDLEPPPVRIEFRQSRSDPNLPRRPHTSHASSPLNDGRPRPTPSNRQSGLWAAPPPSRPAPVASTQQPKSAPTFADTTAPAFSRAALRRSGVIMPAPASYIPSSPRRIPSTPSLSPSSSTSSISSVSSISSSNGSSSKGTMNDFIPLPPRAGFMRRPSSLSLSSTSSSESIATITTGHKGGMSDKDVGYGQDLLGGGYKAAKAQRVTEGDTIQQKKEKEKGMMRGFGKMFGMKKRA